MIVAHALLTLLEEPERLREDVLDTCRLQDGAHRTTGNDTRSRSRWLQHHFGAALPNQDIMRDRRSDHRHMDQAVARCFDAFADRIPE